MTKLNNKKMSETGNIVTFNGNYDDLVTTIRESNHLCVVDFFGTWCGPCKRLLGLLPTIAKDYPDVTFIKIDIDKNEELATKYNIQSVPHIKFFKPTSQKDVTELGTVVGCNPDGIKAKIAEFK